VVLEGRHAVVHQLIVQRGAGRACEKAVLDTVGAGVDLIQG